ncbi:unnamed protein product [Notodromas monacha]|uniref:Peptidase S1 domain-containing protein n=1 Tax=Notodromas monacha TaxID=399045 RepID=A0A7R9BL40_9CRUS|nr:unnamed protein product [Notodromas monacha]CAG0916166.1 unnamed protein product [Notodromas monacha]
MRTLVRKFTENFLLNLATGQEVQSKPVVIVPSSNALVSQDPLLTPRKTPKLISIELKRYVPSGSFKPAHTFMHHQEVCPSTKDSMMGPALEIEEGIYPGIHKKNPYGKVPKLQKITQEPLPISVTEDIETGTITEPQNGGTISRLPGGGRGGFFFFPGRSRRGRDIDGPFNGLAQCMYCILVLALITILMSGEEESPGLFVPKIEGGEDVNIRQPYFFLARIESEFAGFSKAQKSGAALKLCTGAIITQDWVLTAAHCFFNTYGKRATKVSVTVGDISHVDFEGREILRQGSPVIYPYYVHGGRRNDIAMVKLDGPLPYNPFIGQIKMTNNISLPMGDTDALTLAWGMNYSPEPLKPIFDRDVKRKKPKLKRAFVKITSQKSCSKSLRDSGAPWNFRVTPDTLCYTGATNAICFGNDGGPVIQSINNQLVLVGINSFSRNKDFGGIYASMQCDKEVPTIATRVSSYYKRFILPTVSGIDILSPDYYDPED